jgi:uncharacterized protein
MRIDLRKFGEGTSFHTITSVPEKIPFLEDLPFKDEIRLKLTIVKTGSSFDLSGKLEADLYLECARCLEVFNYNIRSALHAVAKIGAKGIQESDQNDGEGIFYLTPEDQTVDLSGIVKDDIVLSMPIKPLCKEDCRGLCPGCGNNLNTSACACKTADKDPRWHKLARIKSRIG